MFGKFSVRKPYTVLVAVVLVIVLGVVSFTKMTTDLLPNISLPYVIVMTTYTGASPETVEMVVTKPVESSMATVSNIESISSVSNENYSMVILEFAQSADMNAASLEIRENLDQLKSYWDDAVGNPIIMKLNPDMLPVMVAAVGGKNMTSAQISKLTNNTIIPELESIEGVASASATGILEESVNVIIRQEKIDQINEQIFDSIDEEIDENLADLQKNKQEIYDGQAELEDARKELADSQEELIQKQQDLEEARKELQDSKQKLADGRVELNEKKTQLENGKNELNSKKEASQQQLAEAETQLLTAKTQTEASKTHLQMEMQTAQATVDAYEQVKTAMNGAAELLQLLEDLKTATPSTTWSAMSSELQSQVMTLVQGAGLTTVTFQDDSAITEVITAVEAAKTVYTSKEAALKDTALMQQAAISEYQSAIAQIDANIGKLNDALTELYKGNLKAAVELANAQTAITLGEMQITSAESQLTEAEQQIESGEEQLISGQEQLDSGRKQIEDGYEQLNDSAEQLSDALQQILDGEEQLEEAREDAYDQADMHGILTVETVEQLLTAQNFSMPAGYVTEEGISYLIRVGDKPETVEELQAMPLLNPDMEGVDVITLGDVADVFMTDNSEEIYTNVNGEPGILLTMQKQTGYSTGDVSDKILEKFDELLEEDEDLMLITLMDQGIYIDLVMDSILSNIFVGAGLAVLILILFLRDIRPTAVIACSIPISIVTAIVCMYFSGVTLNVISLSGLALGIGMLVDNSIVVIENIYRLRSEGASVKDAAIEGTKEVAGAIASSTLTTVCVFLPIVFTDGITRQLFVDMGLTIGYSLGASLLVALTVVPAMASKTLVKTKEQKNGRFYTGMLKLYEKLLSVCLKYKVVVFAVVLILLGLSAWASLSKGTAFMPEMESPQMTISLELPKDTPLKDTAAVTDDLVAILQEMEEIEDVGAMASTSTTGLLLGGGDSSTHATQLYVTLSDESDRSNRQIVDKITQNTADLCENNQAEISIETSMMDMSALGGSGISIQVRGREIDTLQKLANEVAAIVEATEGTTEVSDGMEESTEEMRILVDRDQAMEHGITVAEVFSQIAGKLAAASSATTLETGSTEYDVYVKNAEDMTLTRKLVQEIVIEKKNKDNKKVEIPLADIATFESTISPKSVQRVEQNRYIEVSAQIADGYNVGLVSADLEKKLDDYMRQMPEGYTLVMTGENETINEAMEQLMLMLVLALIFMYLIMVAQFQSLLSPFIIMFTIPLAFTGGFMGLFISNSEVSVIAVIGFVMLSGVIVNNGIVIVDYMNQLRSQGMEMREAILTAGKTRLRPVLMTALTTILGLLPMVFGTDMGAAMGRPMAVVTVGGLLYGTLLTLVVIPCVYEVFTKRRKNSSEGTL